MNLNVVSKNGQVILVGETDYGNIDLEKFYPYQVDQLIIELRQQIESAKKLKNGHIVLEYPQFGLKEWFVVGQVERIIPKLRTAAEKIRQANRPRRKIGEY